MQLKELAESARAFAPILHAAKTRSRDVSWYPYESLANFDHFAEHFVSSGREMFSKLKVGTRILDVGAADGDMSFFLSSLGAEVTIADNASTNFNDCMGMKHLQSTLDNNVSLIERDLDFSIEPLGSYDLAIFLGILYHLRNPMKALISLAESSETMVVSTAVISCLRADGNSIEEENVCMLMPCRQKNNDPTNYWYVTPASFRVLLKRSGWNILDEFRVGDIGKSTPESGDERIFAYCKRVDNWRDLKIHHDF